MGTRAFAASLLLGASLGCAHLADGTGPPSSVRPGAGWIVVEGIRFRAQRDVRGCGPAALGMVLAAWGRPAAALDGLTEGREGGGVTARQLRDAARLEGLSSFVFPGTVADLAYELGRAHPLVLGVASRTGLRRYSHFIVLAGVNPRQRTWLVADPDRGWRVLDHEELMAEWGAAGMVTLVAYPPTS